MKSLKHILETEEIEEENVTGGGEAYSTPFAFKKKKKRKKKNEGLSEVYNKSINTLYNNQSPNRKMNLVLLKSVRCLKEAKGYLTQLSDMKQKEGMQGSNELWEMSKKATRTAGDVLRDIQTLLRNIEA